MLASMQDRTTHCPICAVPLVYAADDTTPAHATLDRIVPGVPYSVVGNLTILCLSCNRRKNDGDLAFFRQLVMWLERVEPAAKVAVEASAPQPRELEPAPSNAYDHLRWVESLG